MIAGAGAPASLAASPPSALVAAELPLEELLLDEEVLSGLLSWSQPADAKAVARSAKETAIENGLIGRYLYPATSA